jgi:hypothetical protein
MKPKATLIPNNACAGMFFSFPSVAPIRLIPRSLT